MTSAGAAVRAEGLGKTYPPATRRYLLFQLWKTVRGQRPSARPEELPPALRDVSFAVAEGESLGVIGANGSGKSTLLRLLAGIERPTAGRVEMRGRLGTLLELTAGFHPDLSGADNVIISGTLMGCRRREMEQAYDAIVRFAELERHMHSPIRTYSSGMLLRLGFAVAIHARPDVLLIDEGLAVGDESFQHKCRDAIKGFQRDGKTLIIVSHNLELIRELCGRVLWLDGGRVRQSGAPDAVIRAYLEDVAARERPSQ